MTNLNKKTETTKRAVKVVRRTRHYLVFDAVTEQVLKNLPIRMKHGCPLKYYCDKNGLEVIDYGRAEHGDLKNVKWGLKAPFGLGNQSRNQLGNKNYEYKAVASAA